MQLNEIVLFNLIIKFIRFSFLFRLRSRRSFFERTFHEYSRFSLHHYSSKSSSSRRFRRLLSLLNTRIYLMLIDRENKSWKNVLDILIQNVYRIQYFFSKLTHSNARIEIFDFFKSLWIINNDDTLHFEHHRDQHRFSKRIHFFRLHDEYVFLHIMRT